MLFWTRNKDKNKTKRRLQPYLSDLTSLETAMEDLLRDHPVAGSMDDLFGYINLYAGRSLTQAEYDYCKKLIERRVHRGMDRYDNERL